MFKLRPFQKAALEALENPRVAQNHVLCISPTGSGKSLIYEKAAAARNRRTLLITPLVALARQQFAKLQNLGIPVTLGAGGLSQGPPSGETGAWIVSPETLSFQPRKAALRKWEPNLLVVDECHCLWEWGKDFRPAFSLIPPLLQDYTIPKSLWLTATLPHPARLQLRSLLPQPLIELGGFELPAGLRLFVRRVPWVNRSQAMLHWVLQKKGPGIVFVSTREATLRISRLLEATGKSVIGYHGGMSVEERRNLESQVSKNIPDVIVATSAFGMGMDYPHLTYVVLWQAPTSLLSLVQTIGRVGRNENSVGQALALWDRDDFQLLEWTVQESAKRRTELMDLLQFLDSKECRRKGLKRYFDQIEDLAPCQLCDYCCDHYNSTFRGTGNRFSAQA